MLRTWGTILYNMSITYSMNCAKSSNPKSKDGKKNVRFSMLLRVSLAIRTWYDMIHLHNLTEQAISCNLEQGYGSMRNEGNY